MLSEVITGVLWQFIYHPQYGLVRAFYAAFFPGTAAPALIGNPSTVLWAIMIVVIWKYFGLHMTIYIAGLQGIPQEQIEAATIDGAPEWTVFTRISLPMVKPILAVGMLNAFIAAYNGWEWAIIVAQDPKIWTIAVWTYQFSRTLAGAPYVVMASFIVNSIPVLLVFLFCQKIILRGIILPQMK